MGRSAPARVTSEDLHVPSARPGVLDLRGDELGVSHEVLGVDAGALLHQFEGEGQLGVGDAGSLLLEDHFNLPSEDVRLDCGLLPLQQVGEAKGLLHLEGEHARHEQEKEDSFHF